MKCRKLLNLQTPNQVFAILQASNTVRNHSECFSIWRDFHAQEISFSNTYKIDFAKSCVGSQDFAFWHLTSGVLKNMPRGVYRKFVRTSGIMSFNSCESKLPEKQSKISNFHTLVSKKNCYFLVQPDISRFRVHYVWENTWLNFVENWNTSGTLRVLDMKTGKPVTT